MGYRLYARIPNVAKYNDYVELGKQYDFQWDEMNSRWFGDNQDKGLISFEYLNEFFNDILETNDLVREYKLYNLDLLKEMIDYAVLNEYDMYFESF